MDSGLLEDGLSLVDLQEFLVEEFRRSLLASRHHFMATARPDRFRRDITAQLQIIELEFQKFTGCPKVGEYVQDGGVLHRIACFSADCGRNGFQPVSPHHSSGSFYLMSGDCSLSGGLEHAIWSQELIETNQRQLGYVWQSLGCGIQANNAVHFRLPFRVWRRVPE